MVSSTASDAWTLNLPLTSIKLPTDQPRQYFDPVKISALAESIKEHGVLEPIIVRPLDQDRYELVAGERRFRASQEAGLSSIPSSIRDLSQSQAQKIALVENLQREDLNPVEEVEGILHLLGIELQDLTQTDWTPKLVISLLYRMQNEAKGKVTHKVMGSAKAEVMEQTLSSLGMSWQSFITNRLPVLKWPDDVLSQTKIGAIAFENAKVISRIKDDKARRKLLKQAIIQSLSISDIKKRIKNHQAKVPFHPSGKK
ncbi:MAG: ParB/RepB/Spo0J family partition protein [Cyanobacteria bacterium P01_F01_bin.150]